jgi:RND family efflux transporter MFP subunit
MKSQHERLTRVGKNIIDKDAIEETLYGLEASTARLAMSRSDVNVKQAHLRVAKENRDQVKALLQYTRLTAPFDGVVTRRNVYTGHFVQPATGIRAEALYVVERRDQVRVFVDVPEADAGWVSKGAKALVRIPALEGLEISGEVARTSYALDRTTRTLVAEIDLPNPTDQLRPGMYSSATISAERPNVLTLPLSAILTQGDVLQGYQTYCFLVEDGKVRKIPIMIGPRDRQRVEVLRKQRKPAAPGKPAVWEDFSGKEQIVQGDLSGLVDGQPVAVAQSGQ